MQEVIEISQIKQSPLGALWAAAGENGLRAFMYGVSQTRFLNEIRSMLGNHRYPLVAAPHPALPQVAQYLVGEREYFDVHYDWHGISEFRQTVYRAVLAVPYGHTAVYGEIAEKIGKPGAARAVGGANASNPFPILVPCHRLVGADGRLRGYGGVGGLKDKQWLLNLEKNTLASGKLE